MRPCQAAQRREPASSPKAGFFGRHRLPPAGSEDIFISACLAARYREVARCLYGQEAIHVRAELGDFFPPADPITTTMEHGRCRFAGSPGAERAGGVSLIAPRRNA